MSPARRPPRGCSTPPPRPTRTSSIRRASSLPTRSCSSRRGRRRVLVMSDLEMDRARAQARVDEVRSWSALAKAEEAAGGTATPAAVIARALRAAGPAPRGGAAQLLARPGHGPRRAGHPPGDGAGSLLAGARDEAAGRGARHHGRAARRGGGAGGRASPPCAPRRIGRDGWLRRDGRRFTAEDLRAAVNTRIMALGCVPAHTICAPGDQAVDPHEEGHGPIRAHTPIVMDIFPRSETHGLLRRPHAHGRARPRQRAPAGGLRARERGRAPRATGA